MAELVPTMTELRETIDSELETWLAARRSELPYSDELIDEMLRLLRAGGKRLRPAFCYWGYRCTGSPHSRAIVAAAASLELLHTFAIVHDDIMDASDERRNQPTVHALHGVNVALLVGDLALVLADDMFMGSGFPPERLSPGFQAYSRMRQEVIVGQYLDLRAAHEPVVDEERVRLVARLKSGRYSIEEPLAIGAALGGAPAELVNGLGRFGAPLGEAFQLRDDLLGTFGERASLGKPVDSDIREGKRTLLYAKTAAALDNVDEIFFLDRWGGGKGLEVEEVQRLRALVESSGARTATEKLLEELTAEALAALEALPVGGEERAALAELVSLATSRAL